MPSLHIYLLGQFLVELDGQPVTRFRSIRSRLLLAYLVSQPDIAHPRTTLATLLWGNMPEVTAKTHLRVELSGLKKRLGAHPALSISRYEVTFHSELANVDVVQFATGTDNLQPDQSLDEIASAVAHYRGEFLTGLSLDDAPDFDDWRLMRQEQLHQQAMTALDWLRTAYTRRSDWQAVVGTAQRQLGLIPWHEPAHQSLIAALMAQGQSAEAQAQLDKCRAVLASELGVPPAAETEALIISEAIPTPKHNLETELTPIIGRGRELATLIDWVAKERLVTILGIGGVGKSTLSQTVARAVLQQFRDGVWFIPLAGIEASATAAERIAQLIAETLDIKLSPAGVTSTQVAQALAGRELLLVLDNWEHLAHSAETILHTLLTQTSIHILATSRQSLNVSTERRLVLKGLPLQAATTLFNDRASRRISTADLALGQATITHICELLEGLPLGIELAASQVAHFSLEEIAQSLKQNFAALSNLDTSIDRHRSLKAVFDFSWFLLSQREQTILSQLTVFRGSFDRAAAQQITSTSVSELAALLNASLVRRAAAGRYSLHEVIRTFAADQLANGDTAAQQHSAYYLHVVQQTLDSGQVSNFVEDLDNVRGAWLSALEQRRVVLLSATAEALTELFMRNGLIRDAAHLLQAGIDSVAAWPSSQAVRELLAQLYLHLSSPIRLLVGRREAVEASERVLALSAETPTQIAAMSNIIRDGAELGEWEKVDQIAVQQKELAKTNGTPILLATALFEHAAAQSMHFRGDHLQSIADLEAAIDLLGNAPADERFKERIYKSISAAAVRYRDLAKSLHYAWLKIDAVHPANHNRYYEVDSLLGLGLSQQFAGLYSEAVESNLTALKIAKEIEDVEGCGLLHANLCMTLRQMEQLDEALAHGQTALALLDQLSSPRIEGMARNRTGHVLLALGRYAEAEQVYASAENIWREIKHSNLYEALAGRAAAAAHQGKTVQAAQFACTVIEYGQENGLMGFVEPVNMMLQCILVFDSAEQPAQTATAIQLAQTWIDLVAERTSDPKIRQTFLTQRTANRLFAQRMGQQ